jgi:hypothetical protein
METISYIAPKSEVCFKALDCKARINFVKIDLGKEVIYNIAYYADGQQRFCEVYSDEIEE